MRTLILLVLVGILIALAVDSASQSYTGPFAGHGNWTVALFGMRVPAEAFVIGLIVAIFVLFPRRKREPRADASPAAAVTGDLQAIREVSQMLERMERRIESLETILLDREARVKRTAENE